MAITSRGYTGAVNSVHWAAMAGSLGFDYVAKGVGDWKVTAVSGGTRTVRVAPGFIAGGGVLDENTAPINLSLPNVTTGSKWFMIVAKRTWQTTNATTVAVIDGTAVKQLPARDTGFGDEDDQPLALVRIAAGQTVPAEVVDLRAVGNNNGVMVGFDPLVLEYLDTVGTVVRIGDTDWTRSLTLAGVPVWSNDTRAASHAVGRLVRSDGASTLNVGNSDLRVVSGASTGPGWTTAWNGSGIGNTTPGIYYVQAVLLTSGSAARHEAIDPAALAAGTVNLGTRLSENSPAGGNGACSWGGMLVCPSGLGVRFVASSSTGSQIRAGVGSAISATLVMPL